MILVVDHDPEVLEQASKTLNRDRQVFLASSAEKAFGIIKKNLGFSVVLVDLELPGDPIALIRKLQDTHPDCRSSQRPPTAKHRFSKVQNTLASLKFSRSL